MMMNEWFVVTLAMIMGLALRWGFKNLPQEKWQMIAAVPQKKLNLDEWRAFNLTFYGFFSACAHVFGVALFLVLLRTLEIPFPGIIAVVTLVLAVCMPSARIIARRVEKKAHTFSIGGASFVGIIIAPWIIFGINLILRYWYPAGIPVIPAMAAGVIAYAFGEGLGRLACISYGCCYGKKISNCHPLLQRLFSNRGFVFWGKTKKISYASDMEGKAVLPIQAMTAVIYIFFGIISIYLFLEGSYLWSFLIPLTTTQLWRAWSETLRADYRGNRKFTCYQIMALVSVLYSILPLTIFHIPAIMPQADIIKGLQALWHIEMLLFLQILWLVSFIYTGKSTVTNAVISFHVITDRI
jgi:hypothetical protein